MSDPRFDSCHLDFPRRTEYRRCREGLLGDRGWVTRVAEHVHDWMADDEDWPVEVQQVVPGTQYLLLDRTTGCRYLLATGLNSIGRFPDNDIVFEEKTVSRRHCAVLVHARGGCELHDTASRNGTFVNGARVGRPVRLTSGDGIRICDRLLQFLDAKDDRSGCADEEHPATAVG
jgi:pSer/pThr/pTyr-binding forkhead associated (FHA) protein